MVPQPGGKKRAAKHIAIYSIGTLLRQLTGFIMLPVYTSYLSPEDYGVVGLLVVMVSLFELLLGARMTQSVPKYYYDAESSIDKQSVIITALLLTLTVSATSALIVGVFSSPISNVIFGSYTYSQHVAVYSILLLTTAVEAYGICFIRLQEKPFLFIANSIGKLVVQLSLSIYFVVVLEMGAMGVVLSTVIASGFFALILLAYLIYYNGLKFNKSMSYRLIAFSWPLWVAGIAGIYNGSANRYFLRMMTELSEVGLLELAVKFGAIVGVLVWSPFSQWWQTEKFKIFKYENNGRDVYPVVFNAIACVIVMAGFGIATFAGPVIEIMSNDRFHEAQQAVPMSVYAVLMEKMTFFFLLSFMVTERTIIIAYVRYGSAIVMTGLFFLLIPKFGFVGATAASFGMTTFAFLLYYYLSKRVCDLNIKIGAYLFLVAASLALLYIESLFTKDLSNFGFELLVKALSCFIMLAIICVFVYRDRALSKVLRQATALIKRKLRLANG